MFKKKIEFKGIQENFSETFKDNKDYEENIYLMNHYLAAITEEDGNRMEQIVNDIKQDVNDKIEPMLNGSIPKEAKDCVAQMLEIKKRIPQLKNDIWKLSNEDTHGKPKRELQIKYLIDGKKEEIRNSMKEYERLMMKAFDVVKADKVIDEMNDLVYEHKRKLFEQLDHSIAILMAKQQILYGLKGKLETIDDAVRNYVIKEIGIHITPGELNCILQAVRNDEPFADIILKEVQ